MIYQANRQMLETRPAGNTGGTLIESGGQSAVITGDVTHHPCQLAHPDWGSTSDFDSDLACTSRMRLVERFADSDTVIIGSHYADPVAGRIRRTATSFRLVSVQE